MAIKTHTPCSAAALLVARSVVSGDVVVVDAQAWRNQLPPEREVFLKSVVQRDQVRVETQLTGDGADGHDVARLLTGVKNIVVASVDTCGAIGLIKRSEAIDEEGQVCLLLPDIWNKEEVHRVAAPLGDLCLEIFREVNSAAKQYTRVEAYTTTAKVLCDVRYPTTTGVSPVDLRRYMLAVLLDLAEEDWPPLRKVSTLHKWMNHARKGPNDLRVLLLGRLRYMAAFVNPSDDAPCSPKALLAQITGPGASGPLLQGPTHTPARLSRMFRDNAASRRRRSVHSRGSERNKARRVEQDNMDVEGVTVKRELQFAARARGQRGIQTYCVPSGVGKPQLVVPDPNAAEGGATADKKRKRSPKGQGKHSDKKQGKRSDKGQGKRSDKGQRKRSSKHKRSKKAVAADQAGEEDGTQASDKGHGKHSDKRKSRNTRKRSKKAGEADQAGECGELVGWVSSGEEDGTQASRKTAQKRIQHKCARAPQDVLPEDCPGWSDLSAERQAELLGKPPREATKKAHRGIRVMTTGVYTSFAI